jgi:hypothetical protein
LSGHPAQIVFVREVPFDRLGNRSARTYDEADRRHGGGLSYLSHLDALLKLLDRPMHGIKAPPLPWPRSGVTAHNRAITQA